MKMLKCSLSLVFDTNLLWYLQRLKLSSEERLEIFLLLTLVCWNKLQANNCCFSLFWVTYLDQRWLRSATSHHRICWFLSFICGCAHHRGRSDFSFRVPLSHRSLTSCISLDLRLVELMCIYFSESFYSLFICLSHYDIHN